MSLILICINVISYAQDSTSVTNQTNTQETTVSVESPAASTSKPATKAPKERGIDWFSVIIGGSYLLAIFALFPLVVFTNIKEKFSLTPKNPSLTEEAASQYTMEERNQRAYDILESIENKLTVVEGEDGSEMVTITKGSQARYMRNGLDYIINYLQPDNQEVFDRINEFKEVYDNRTQRYFSGSKWILGCAIAIIVLMAIMDAGMLLSGFMLIHVIGIAFYYLASKVPAYILDKRLKTFGSKGKGLVGVIFTSLFAGAATKHYVSINGGPWKRDHSEEFSNNMMYLMIAAIVALMIGFMVSLFGVINFLLNYSSNFILPFNTSEKWFNKNFVEQPVAVTV